MAQLGRSAHIDNFPRDNLPPPPLWPEIPLKGFDYPDTLVTRNNLAEAYRAAGRLDEAITLHQRTLTDREQTLGDTHPNTLNSRNNLAVAYHDAGRLDEARVLRNSHLRPEGSS